MIRMWLDDIRPPPPDDDDGAWSVYRSAEEAQAVLGALAVDEASLDHDLGECAECASSFPQRGYKIVTDTCRHKMTGYDLVKWMAEFGKWPRQKPRVHSANLAWAGNMRATIDRYWSEPTS